MQGNGAAPEKKAVIVANREIGGRQFLSFHDILRDQREEVLFIEQPRVEWRTKSAGEMIAG
jgi:hypothetical protein